MRWWGWGDPHHQGGLPVRAAELLQAEVGLGDGRRVALEEVRLGDPALGAKARDRLVAAVGADGVRDDREARVLHAGGKSYPNLVRLRSGDAGDAPDAVVMPASAEQVRAVVKGTNLPWREGALRGFVLQFGTPFAIAQEGCEGGWWCGGAVARLGVEGSWYGEIRTGGADRAQSRAAGPQKRGVGFLNGNDQFVGGVSFGDDHVGFFVPVAGNADAFALAEGVQVESFVFAENPPFEIDDGAGLV